MCAVSLVSFYCRFLDGLACCRSFFSRTPTSEVSRVDRDSSEKLQAANGLGDSYLLS